MRNQQESGNPATRRRRNLLAIAGAIVLAVAAVAAGISTHEEPAARYVVVECQGFEALASVGSKHVSCDAEPAEAAASEAAPQARPVDSRSDADVAPRVDVVSRAKV